jgi:hypothetical protein
MGYAKHQPLKEPMAEPKQEAVTWMMMPGNELFTRKVNLRLWLRGKVSYRWAPEFGRYVDMSHPSRLRTALVARGKVVGTTEG